MKASWPVPGEIDETLIKSDKYLEDSAHSFRIRLNNILNPGKKKSSAAAVKKQPNSATIWIAEKYPPWQSQVLKCLENSYKVRCLVGLFLT